MSVIEFEGPPSWSLDASQTWESTKCPWVGESSCRIDIHDVTKKIWDCEQSMLTKMTKYYC